MLWWLKVEFHLKNEASYLSLLYHCRRSNFFFLKQVPISDRYSLHFCLSCPQIPRKHHLWCEAAGPLRMFSTTCIYAMGTQLWSTRNSEPASHIQDGGAGNPNASKCDVMLRVHWEHAALLAYSQWEPSYEAPGILSQLSTSKMAVVWTQRPVKNCPGWGQHWIIGLVTACLLKVSSDSICLCWLLIFFSRAKFTFTVYRHL